MTSYSRRNFLCAIGVVGLSGEALGASLVRLQVVTASSIGIKDISLSDLRQIYKGRPLSLGAQLAIPFNHPAHSPDRVGFDQAVLGMNPDEVARYWVDQKIRGGAEPPRKVESAALLLRLLSRLPGAIGYVREGFSAPDVRVLSIDRRLPGDAGYPLVYSE